MHATFDQLLPSGLMVLCLLFVFPFESLASSGTQSEVVGLLDADPNTAHPGSPRRDKPTTAWSVVQRQLRSFLMAGAEANKPLGESMRFQYDAGAPPAQPDYHWGGMFGWSHTSLNRNNASIQMGMQLTSLVHIDVARQSAVFGINLQLRWEDYRLRWNSSSHGCGQPQGCLWSQDILLSADTWDVSESDIFVPDITLLHDAGSAPAGDINQGLANVNSVGNVHWRRHGLLTSTCKFELASFPFDTSVCEFTLLPYGSSSRYIEIIFEELQPHFSSSHQSGEFTVTSTKCQKVQVRPPGGISTQLALWDAVSVNVTLHRVGQGYYWSAVIVPYMVLTILSFGVFWSSGGSGERLKYGTATVFIGKCLEMIVDPYLPVCSCELFLVRYMEGNMLFLMFTLLESAVVVALFYKTDEDLTPKWYQACYQNQLEKVGFWHAPDIEAKLSFMRLEPNEALESHVANRGLHEARPKTLLLSNETEHQPETEEQTETTMQLDDVPYQHPLPKVDTLVEWLELIGYERYESAFRKIGVNTLPQLVECHLAEEEVKHDLGIDGLLARRRLVHHLQALTGKKMRDALGPLQGMVAQLRTGLAGHEDVMLSAYGAASLVSDTKVAGGLVVDDGGAALQTEKQKQQTEEKLQEILKAETALAIHEYWVAKSKLVDLAAQAVMPLAYIIHISTVFGSY